MTRLVGQLMSNEAFVSALQGAMARAVDAKLVLDSQLRAALARLGVPTQENIEVLRNEVGELNAEVQRLHQEIERLRSEAAAQATRAKPAVAKQQKNGSEIFP